MSEGRRYAILIGSSRFDNEPKLSALRCPEHDVDGMRAVLATEELGAFGEIVVCKNEESHRIMRQIEEMLTAARPHDQVLIYYSGHGKTDLPGRLFLATANTEVKALVSSSLPVENLRLMIDNSTCRKIILILDCCYSGAAGKSFARGNVDEKLQELARGSGVYLLTASTASQVAHEQEGDDHGLLTKHIIQGIKRGEADLNNDGFVSMDDLYGYVFTKVKAEGHQEPMRWALNVKGEDLIIARTNGKSARERQRVLVEKIIDVHDSLPRQVFQESLKVIHERREPFYGLIESLFQAGLPVGDFVSEWYRLESSESEPLLKPAMKLALPKRSFAFLLKLLGPTLISARKPKRVLRLLAFPILLVVAIPALTAIFNLARTGEDQKRRSSVENSIPADSTTEPVWDLRLISFETATLNPEGKEASRSKLQADFFVESVGDGVELEMVKIPEGQFMMGSPTGEAGRFPDENSQHQVNVPGFFLGRFEVTRAQWQQISKLPKVTIDLTEDPSNFKSSWRQPVENVSWHDAIEFCARLANKTKKSYRLPTEAEWEYAARAGTSMPFAFGPTITPKYVNCNGDYRYGSVRNTDLRHYGLLSKSGIHTRERTVEVGSLKLANAFGLYDMHGNVSEWCQDAWHDSYNGAPVDGSAWEARGDGRRVIRGGSWDLFSDFCRSASRGFNDPAFRDKNLGFRVALVSRT